MLALEETDAGRDQEAEVEDSSGLSSGLSRPITPPLLSLVVSSLLSSPLVLPLLSPIVFPFLCRLHVLVLNPNGFAPVEHGRKELVLCLYIVLKVFSS